MAKTTNSIDYDESDVQRFWSKINKKGPRPDQSKAHYKGLKRCWIVTSSSKSKFGHHMMWLKGRNVWCHRFSWTLANGPIPNNLWVLHKCDNPACCNPDHLFLGNQSDNMKDAHAKGRATKKFGVENPANTHRHRMPIGSGHKNSKITEDMVREIRRRYIPRVVSLDSLGKEFGISEGNTWHIIKRKTWTHVD